MSTEPAAPEAQALSFNDWPKAAYPLAGSREENARIETLLGRLSLEQKVGQILQADIASTTPEDVATYHLGSVLNGGNSAPGNNQRAAPEEWLALADAFWEASMREDGPGIPVLWGTDAVHGHNNIAGATIFPQNINLGATRDAGLVERIGAATALEVRATGMDWTFAPTVAVARDDRWGRSYEAYSESPALVAELGAAAVRGLQGRYGTPGFLGPDRVIATAKHFIGDGGTLDGIDQGETDATEGQMRNIHAAGYYSTLAAGVQSVMASFSSWQGRKMHGREDFLTGLLKRHWNYDGLVVGDWNGHGQLPGATPTDCPQALNAGLDMYMAPDSWKGLRDSLLQQVQDGTISMQRLDEAVRAVLRLKLRAGLFSQPKPSLRPHGGDFALLGCEAHTDLAREAVRKSAVLLKNAGHLLPISPKQDILVAGRGADHLGMLCGGWTLNWQAQGLTKSDFPHAETILEGIQRVAGQSGGRVRYSETADYADKPDVVIYVFGENPYAEFRGDLTTLDFKPGDTRDLDALRRFKADGIPVVSVFLSGRPLWVNPEINASDAFIAAFLPGTQSGALADLLFTDATGRPVHDFTGRLGFSWPEFADQYQLNEGDAHYAPLFPFGFGLSIGDDGDLAELHETGVATEPDHGVIFDHGSVAGSWKLVLADTDGLVDWKVGQAHSAARALSVRPADLGQQENAIEATWHDTACAALSFVHEPLNLSREANADFCLKLEIGNDPEGCANCSLAFVSQAGRTDLGPLSALSLENVSALVTRVTVPLKKLTALGVDLETIRALEIWNQGRGRLVLSHASLSTL